MNTPEPRDPNVVQPPSSGGQPQPSYSAPASSYPAPPTSPSAPGVSYPAPPGMPLPPAPPQSGKKKPGIVGIVMGIILMVVGPGIGVILIIIGTFSAVSDHISAETFSSGETIEYQLDANTEYAIWVDEDTAYNGSGACYVYDSSGAPVMLENPSTVTTVVRGSDTYLGQITFTTSTAGTYTAMCEVDTDGTMFVATALTAEGFGEAAIGWVIGGMAVGAICFIGGLIWLIVTIVRRSRWTRANAYTAQYPQR